MDWAAFFTSITTAVSGFVTPFLAELPDIAGAVLPVILGIAGVTLGLKLVRRFIR